MGILTDSQWVEAWWDSVTRIRGALKNSPKAVWTWSLLWFLSQTLWVLGPLGAIFASWVYWSLAMCALTLAQGQKCNRVNVTKSWLVSHVGSVVLWGLGAQLWDVLPWLSLGLLYWTSGHWLGWLLAAFFVWFQFRWWSWKVVWLEFFRKEGAIPSPIVVFKEAGSVSGLGLGQWVLLTVIDVMVGLLVALVTFGLGLGVWLMWRLIREWVFWQKLSQSSESRVKVFV